MTTDERAQIRAEAIHDCLDALPVWMGEPINNPLARRNAILDCAESITRLLRPDPVEASEPLQSVNAPVDHGPRADAHGEAGTLHEPTVRACIEALPYPGSNGDFRRALESLLPKPDSAKDLVDRWMGEADWQDLGVTIAVEEYTRWLIDTGSLKV